MLRKLVNTIIFTISLIVLFSSCKKDDDSSPNIAKKAPINLNNTRGKLEALKLVSRYDSSGIQKVQIINQAQVSFYDSYPFVGTWQFAGVMSCEGVDLYKDTNNFRYSTNRIGDPIKKINFNHDVNWKATGSPDVPSFNVTTTIGFPYASIIKSDTFIGFNQDYTVAVDTLINADSVTYQLFDITKTYVGNVKTHRFDKNDLQVTGPGDRPRHHQLVMRIYRHEVKNISGKNYYFKNTYVNWKWVYTK